ncbi:ATP-binding protein [Myceligenerans halotolerans]
MSTESFADALARSALFAEVSRADIEWTAELARDVDAPAGLVLFREGDDPDRFVVLLHGELLISTRVDDRDEELTRHSTEDSGQTDKPGEAHGFTGEMPLLANVSYVATATVSRDSRVAIFDRAAFNALLERVPQVCRVLLPVLAWRLHSSSIQAGQRATIMALGTLAAGLAHELNNPAAAVGRSARALQRQIPALVDAATAWGATATAAEARHVADVIAAVPAAPEPLSGIARSAREDELVAWLEDHTRIGNDDVDDLAEALVESGMGTDQLDQVAAGVRAEVLDAALGHVAARQAGVVEATAISEAATRISSIVAATKEYTNLDRAPEQEFDVAAGIDSTLRMMTRRLNGIDIRRRYPDEPLVASGYPTELNQVWTNLIENAADAMSGTGSLDIEVRPEGTCVTVAITDTGPGIPEDVRARLFEPFFTTKDIGKGTGLGLHLSHRIITQRHRGSVSVTSKPGRTTFTVRIPRRAG